LDELEHDLENDRLVATESDEFTEAEQEEISETLELIDMILKITNREDISIIKNLIKHLD